jgi:hypothetical protein
LALPITMFAPVACVSCIPFPVPPWMMVVDAFVVEPIVTRLVPEPVGVPVAILTVSPPATEVAPVAMLTVSVKAGVLPLPAPMVIVRFAAGATLPRSIVVTRVLLPRASVATPPVPPPERMFTAVAPVVAPFSIFIVSPPAAVDCPSVIALVLEVDPMKMPFELVVPILIVPAEPAWIDTAVPPVPPWINVCVAAVVLPSVRLVEVAAMVMLPLVVDAEPVSIVSAPDAPLVESPDLIVTAPLLEVPPVPVALPERNETAADGVDAAD